VTWLLVARAIQGIGVGIATGTLGAALIELSPQGNPARGMLVNTTAPTFGMALGALGSGLLVQFAPAPTVLSYAVLLVVFVVLGVLTLTLPETAPSAGHGFKIVPRRISVPKPARRAFGLTALSIVAVWAIGGLYLSLGPSLVAEMLHSNSHVLGGLVVTGLAGGGTVAQLLFRKMSGNRPIVLGGILLLVALALVTVSLSTVSVAVFFVGTVVLGLGWGSAFMGAFRSMAALADPAHRGELLAAVYTVAYLAMSVPSIIAGLVVPHAGLHTTTTWFIGVVAVLVVVALASLPLINRHHRSGAAGAHAPSDHHAPAPCCLPTTHAHPVAAGAAN
jgi:MFS family permease